MKKVILGFVGVILGALIILADFAFLPTKTLYLEQKPFSLTMVILGGLVIIAGIFSLIPCCKKKKPTSEIKEEPPKQPETIEE